MQNNFSMKWPGTCMVRFNDYFLSIRAIKIQIEDGSKHFP
jgi:hypothetical protein